MSLTTIECSKPGAAYTLFESGPNLIVHLAGPGKTGGTGPCICGFDRHARDENGRTIVGFSVGGGTTGPDVIHEVCSECLNLVDGREISGTHAVLFDRGEWRDKQGDVWSLGNDGLMYAPETRPFPRGHVEKKWGPLVCVRPATPNWPNQ